MHIFTDIFILSFAVAGGAVLWRQLQFDNILIRNAVRKLPKLISKALSCGSCFTYWLALAAVILVDPLQGWIMPVRFAFSLEIFSLIRFIIGWMMISIIAIILRFTYVAIQEVVYYQTHYLRKDGHDH